MMRVLTKEAVADPSAVEAKVRMEAAKRQLQHQLHNESRKKTREQKAEKLKKKLKEDTSNEIHVAVFRLIMCIFFCSFLFTFHSRSPFSLSCLLVRFRAWDLHSPQHRFKVDVNAQQYNLTGTVILFENCNVVLVEGGKSEVSILQSFCFVSGQTLPAYVSFLFLLCHSLLGPKGIKKFSRLMLKRIKWGPGEGEDVRAKRVKTRMKVFSRTRTIAVHSFGRYFPFLIFFACFVCYNYFFLSVFLHLVHYWRLSLFALFVSLFGFRCRVS